MAAANPVRHLLVSGVIAIFLLYVAGLLALYWLQGRLIYPGGVSRRPDVLDLDSRFTWVTIKTADGLSLDCLHCPGESESTLGVLLLHGNGDDVRQRSLIAERLADEGYAVVQAEYRGYAGNPGRPSEQGLYADGRAALALLKDAGLGVVIHGYSLGSGVAVQLASEHSCVGLILEAPFTSVTAVAEVRLPWFPVRKLIRDRYDSLSKVAKIHVPVLIYGGTNDRVIPPSHFRELLTVANEPRQLVLIEGAGHTGLWEAGGERAVIDFLHTFGENQCHPRSTRQV